MSDPRATSRAPILAGLFHSGFALGEIARMSTLLLYVCGITLLGAQAFVSVVSAAPTEIRVSQHDPQPSLLGQAVVVRFDLVTEPGAPEPKGTVTIADGSSRCIAKLPQRTCWFVPRSAGTKSLTAAYSGDDVHAPSSSTAVLHTVRVSGVLERANVPSHAHLFGPMLRPTGHYVNPIEVSYDGRFVAFESAAPELVAHDGRDYPDVFVRDMRSGAVEHISGDAQGRPLQGSSFMPTMSRDGRFVAFVTGGMSAREGVVMVHDRQSRRTERLSPPIEGRDPEYSSSWPSVSGDGDRVAFLSWDGLAGGAFELGPWVLVRERSSGNLTQIAPAAIKLPPAISPDGNVVAFTSGIGLVDGDTNGLPDVYVRDLATGALELISKSQAGVVGNGASENPRISGNGRFVAFETEATNLVASDLNGSRKDVIVLDRATGVPERVSVDSEERSALGGDSTQPSISHDGQLVTFMSGAYNLVPGAPRGGVFLRDRRFGTTEAVQNLHEGQTGVQPSISGDGSLVAYYGSRTIRLTPEFDTSATDLVALDVRAGRWLPVAVAGLGSQSSGDASFPRISESGRFVAFVSAADNLWHEALPLVHIYIRDRLAGTTRAVTAGRGSPYAGVFDSMDMSADGSIVAYHDRRSIHVTDTRTGAMRSYEIFRPSPNTADSIAGRMMSGDGRFHLFQSATSALGYDDPMQPYGDYVLDTATGAVERLDYGVVGFAKAISREGRIVLVAYDEASGFPQYALFDRVGRSLQPIPLSGPRGSISPAPSTLALAPNGEFVSMCGARFMPGVSNVEVVSVFRRRDGSVQDIPLRDMDPAGPGCWRTGISDDGSRIVVEAPNGTAQDVVAYDVNLRRGVTLSTALDGSPSDGPSDMPRISADGRYVAFTSRATNLIAGDSNGRQDVFVADLDRAFATSSVASVKLGEASNGQPASPSPIQVTTPEK